MRMVTMRKADEDMAARLAAEQAREAVTAARAEATAANAWAESDSAEVERMRQDAERALGELRASMQREREETAARLAAALQAAQAAATRLDEERATHPAEAGRIERAEAQRDDATAQVGAEPERIRAGSTWQREELRQVLDGRASVLEEARAELPARAGRAGRELDHVRAELGRA